jgi:hypothetical protein
MEKISSKYELKLEARRKFRERSLHSSFNSHTRYTAPMAFEGNNFMTPEVLGVDIVVPGIYVELSAGEGLNRELIFGVTFRKKNRERLDPDPSGSVWSYEEAIELIESVRKKYGIHKIGDWNIQSLLDYINILENKIKCKNELLSLLMGYAPPVYKCRKCGKPYIDGYACTFCGDVEPDEEISDESYSR